jgi:hypothetical protein
MRGGEDAVKALDRAYSKAASLETVLMLEFCVDGGVSKWFQAVFEATSDVDPGNAATA